MTTPAINLDEFKLSHGAHSSLQNGACAMELVSFLANEPFSDHPECASPVIASFTMVWNDAMTDEDRQILQFHFGQLLLGRPLAGPPGIPADRLAALRNALFETMKDPQFLAEATKAGLDIDPVTPDEVMALLKQFSAFSPEILEKAKDAMGR